MKTDEVADWLKGQDEEPDEELLEMAVRATDIWIKRTTEWTLAVSPTIEQVHERLQREVELHLLASALIKKKMAK